MGNQITTDSGFEFKTNLYKYILLLKSDPDPMPYSPERRIVENPKEKIMSVRDGKTYCFTRTHHFKVDGDVKEMSMKTVLIKWENILTTGE